YAASPHRLRRASDAITGCTVDSIGANRVDRAVRTKNRVVHRFPATIDAAKLYCKRPLLAVARVWPVPAEENADSLSIGWTGELEALEHEFLDLSHVFPVIARHCHQHQMTSEVHVKSAVDTLSRAQRAERCIRDWQQRAHIDSSVCSFRNNGHGTLCVLECQRTRLGLDVRRMFDQAPHQV